MDLPIKFEDVANKENEEELNANQSKVELSEYERAAHALEVKKIEIKS
jgi:hypothetical protein